MTSKSGLSDKKKDIFSLIGVVASESSSLELEIKFFISVLLFGNRDDGLSFYDGITSSIILKQLSPAYYLKTNSSKYDEIFDKLIKSIDAVGKRRNDVIHSIWNISDESKRTTRKGKGKQNLVNSKKYRIIIREYSETTEKLELLIETTKMATTALQRLSLKLLKENLIK